MRVIAGIYRSRPLIAPTGVHTRPTADRLRETLFNVLTNGAFDRIVGSSFLDLYAGSGAVGIEAISRGAASVTFVEQAPSAVAILRKNLTELGVGVGVGVGPSVRVRGAARIEKLSVKRFLQGRIQAPDLIAATGVLFDTIFLDPPYEQSEEYITTLNLLGCNSAALVAPGGLVIAEHRRKTPLAAKYGQLFRIRVLEQGDAALSFYQVSAEGNS